MAIPLPYDVNRRPGGGTVHEHETPGTTGVTKRVNPVRNTSGSTEDEMNHLLSLQRAVGNSVVARIVQEEHGTSVQRSSVHDVLRASGRPLDSGVRQEMEARLGGDFSGVRVHDDTTALASAAEMGAQSYTSGQHIVLGHPDDLAHELVHVQQQQAGPVPGTDNGGGLRVSDPSDHAEREAVQVSERAMSGPAPEVQRTPEHDQHSGHVTHEPVVQRISAGTDTNGFKYYVTVGGLYAIRQEDGRSIWAQQGADVSPALEPTGDSIILGGNTYNEYQIRRWLLKDCLHTAEEIINNKPGELKSARELEQSNAPASAGKYSRVRTGPTTWRKFGKDTAGNRADAQAFSGPKDHDAAPGLGQAYAIVALTDPPPGKRAWPYHAAAVVGVDRNERITLEEFDDKGKSSRGNAAIYQIGGGHTFHHAWQGSFTDQETTTIVLDPAATAHDLKKRGGGNKFDMNDFADAPDRTLNWELSSDEE